MDGFIIHVIFLCSSHKLILIFILAELYMDLVVGDEITSLANECQRVKEGDS